MTIVADTSARHDCLCGASTAPRNDGRYGDGAASRPDAQRRATCWPRPAPSTASSGATSPPSVNLFKGVRVGDDGALALRRRRRGPARTSSCGPRWT